MTKAAGLRQGYHNHDFEFAAAPGGGTLFDALLTGTDPGLVDFEMDVYWVTKAGHDPLALMAKYPGRFPLLHLKDASPAPEQKIVDVGTGTIDFPAILKAAKAHGLKHAYVENDQPADAARLGAHELRVPRPARRLTDGATPTTTSASSARAPGRHGRLRAHAGGREGGDARGGRRVVRVEELADAHPRLRVAAPRRRPRASAPSANSTPATAAGTSRASRTPSRPASKFSWWRGRMLGGRTNHWGRISLRFGPDDFKGKSKDGLGDDWPISYDDVAPYYDRVDDLIGIFGSREGLRNHPDGNFQPPPKPRCYELLVKKASDKLGITCIPSRLSIITKPIHGRQACHYCGQCNRGCSVKANFSSPDVLIGPALATGKLTLITNAMAREVTVGQGRARHRRVVRRQAHGTRQAREGEDRRARRQRLRVGAPAAQLEVVAFPAGARQLDRTGGQGAHRHHGHRRRRVHPRAWWTTCRTTRTAWAACTSTCPGGSTTGSSTSRAATTSRCGGGLGAPGYGFMGGIANYPRRRRLRASRSRTTTAATTARRSASAAAAR